MRQDNVAPHILLRLRHVVRPISDHVEVGHSLQLSCTNRPSHTQGVRCDGEESLDRLLPVFYEFRTGCFRDNHCDLLRVTSWYGLHPSKQTSEADLNFESDGIS